MKFVLISRHTNGANVPESERERNMKDMGDWIALLNAEVALPIRGGMSITAQSTQAYHGDIGGLLVFEAHSLDEAVALAKKSPGLRYGFTHEVFPEISMAQASATRVE